MQQKSQFVLTRKFFLNCTILYSSAFDLLSDSSVQATISQLRELLPEELKCLDGTERAWPRVRISSVYEYFEKEQEAEVEVIRKEQALIIPRDFDYSMYVEIISHPLLFYLFLFQP